MGNGNKVEMLIAICALVSSLAAVFIAWDQGRVMRAQQHGSVFPVLQVDGYFSNSNTRSNLGIRVNNNGVGPALIKSVTLKIDGKHVESLNEGIDNLPGTYDVSWESLVGRAIAPGQTTNPLDISWLREDVTFEELASIANDASKWALEVCYCSVFDRCWQTERLGVAEAERVDGCQLSETDIFSQLRTRPQSRSPSQNTPEPEPPTTGDIQ